MVKMTRRRAIAIGAGLFGNLQNLRAQTTSAKSLGYKMPDESTPHQGTFMQWPAIPEIYGSSEDPAAVREKISLIVNAICAV